MGVKSNSGESDFSTLDSFDRLEVIDSQTNRRGFATIDDIRSAITFPVSRTLAGFGDSITAAATQSNTATSVQRSSMGYLTWAQYLSNGRVTFPMANNFGNSGDSTAAMLARIAPVLAAKPGICVVLGGTNDAYAGTAAATTIANLTAIYDALKNANIVVIAIPITGRNSGTAPLTNAQAQAALAVNRWIRQQRFSRGPGFYVADAGLTWDDPATASSPAFAPRTGYTYDGLHPAPIGAAVLGQAVATVINSILPDTAVPYQSAIDVYSTDNPTGNLLTNGLMTGSATAGNFPGFTGDLALNWQTNNASGFGGATAVFSKVVQTDGRTFQRLVLSGNYTGTAAQADVFTVLSAGSLAALTAGSVAEATCEFSVQAGTSNVGGIEFYTSTTAGSSYYHADMFANNTYTMPTTALSGILRTPAITLPSTPTQLLCGFRVKLKNVGAVSTAVALTMDFGSVDLRKLS